MKPSVASYELIKKPHCGSKLEGEIARLNAPKCYLLIVIVRRRFLPSFLPTYYLLRKWKIIKTLCVCAVKTARRLSLDIVLLLRSGEN